MVKLGLGTEQLCCHTMEARCKITCLGILKHLMWGETAWKQQCKQHCQGLIHKSIACALGWTSKIAKTNQALSLHWTEVVTLGLQYK